MVLFALVIYGPGYLGELLFKCIGTELLFGTSADFLHVHWTGTFGLYLEKDFRRRVTGVMVDRQFYISRQDECSQQSAKHPDIESEQDGPLGPNTTTHKSFLHMLTLVRRRFLQLRQHCSTRLTVTAFL